MFYKSPAAKEGLAISIVIFKPNLEKLKTTLLHLKKAVICCEEESLFPESLLLMVDNSTPPLPEDLLKNLIKESYFNLNHPRHKSLIIVAGGNKGFGAGHNKAIRSHEFKYHLVLNPDVYVAPDSLSVCWRYAETNEDTVLIGPLIRSPDGTIQYLLRRTPTLLDAALRFTALFFNPVTRLRRYSYYECRNINMEEPQSGYLLSGCCMWCRTSALLETGGFDESFFLYLEDYDLCRRLSEKGNIFYLPRFQVIHDWERSMARSLKLIITNIKSTIHFFRKWGWKLF